MTAEELYSIINAEIEEKAKHDSRIILLKNRIENGSASLAETVEYNHLVNEIMGKCFSGKVLSTDQREELCKMLLKDSYDKSNEALSTAQRSIDAKTGLKIQPKKAPFPAERVGTVAKSLIDKTVEDRVIQRRAENAVTNVANSFSNDYVKENAKLRSDAGVKCYIERTTDGNCCEWCNSVAGKYEYSSAPDDVFARHDNCSCVCTFINGRTRQDVWSKKFLSEPGKIEYKEPRIISKDEARKLESENITFRGLNSEKSVDKSGKSGIIESEEKRLEKYIGKPIIETDNLHVREWYYANVSDIPNQIDYSLPFDEQVMQAFQLRNKYKHEARVAMSDIETAERLEKLRPAPIFEELVISKMKRKGMTREEALKDILNTASKTNDDVNKEFGL